MQNHRSPLCDDSQPLGPGTKRLMPSPCHRRDQPPDEGAVINVDWNYDCNLCPALSLGLEVHPKSGRIYKFPPAIGCQGEALFAFAGLGPRISDSNRRLHDVIMADRGAYVALGHNRAPDGEQYVRVEGGERHYHTHARIVREAIRGTEYENRQFEDVAVCSELFMCATPTRQTAALRSTLRDNSAICPGLHFWNVIKRAGPKLVVTLGDDVFAYVSQSAVWDGALYRIRTEARPVIIALPHPGHRSLSTSELRGVSEACRAILLNQIPRAWDFRSGQQSSTPTHGNQRERGFEWSSRYGWQVAHRPSDLVWLEEDQRRNMVYLLHWNGKARYRMTLNGAQLRKAIGPYVNGPYWPITGYVNPVTRTIHGLRTEQFLPQWASYVTSIE